MTNENPALGLIDGLRNVLTGQLNVYNDAPAGYALLDFPNHANVGDSAIWLGELAYLEDMIGCGPSFVCERTNLDAEALKKNLPAGPIFLTGGGNFGDVWREHQLFRESVIDLFPGRRIIQFSQTLHFADSVLLKKAARIVNRHPNFILFVRDKRSFEKAESVFDCPVHLAPDMAFYLGAIPRTVSATCRLLLLLRADRESTRQGRPLPRDLPEGVKVANWLEEDTYSLSRMEPRRGETVAPQHASRELLYRNFARHRVSRGIKLLSSADYVITDRLHCHILCVLLGMPHIILDNSYGKLSTFVETWTKHCGLVRMASSLDEAIGMWSQITKTPGEKLSERLRKHYMVKIRGSNAFR